MGFFTESEEGGSRGGMKRSLAQTYRLAPRPPSFQWREFDSTSTHEVITEPAINR
jgi:hypothetical protein